MDAASVVGTLHYGLVGFSADMSITEAIVSQMLALRIHHDEATSKDGKLLVVEWLNWKAFPLRSLQRSSMRRARCTRPCRSVTFEIGGLQEVRTHN